MNLKIMKIKNAGVIAQMEKHNERLSDKYPTNRELRQDLSSLNVQLVKRNGGSYIETIRKRIEEEKCRVRKNSVLALSFIVQFSYDYIIKKSRDEQIKMFSDAFEYFTKKYGEKNMAGAVIHFDENAPHLHIVMVPITSDGRLCCKEIVGNRYKMSSIYSGLFVHMEDKYPELTTPNFLVSPKTVRISAQMFKSAASIILSLEEIEKKCSEMNIFNMKEMKTSIFENASDLIVTASQLKMRMDKNNEYILSLEDMYRSRCRELDLEKKKVRMLEKEKNELVENAKADDMELKRYRNMLRLIPSDVRAKHLKGEKQFDGIFEITR